MDWRSAILLFSSSSLVGVDTLLEGPSVSRNLSRVLQAIFVQCVVGPLYHRIYRDSWLISNHLLRNTIIVIINTLSHHCKSFVEILISFVSSLQTTTTTTVRRESCFWAWRNNEYAHASLLMTRIASRLKKWEIDFPVAWQLHPKVPTFCSLCPSG
jgi:hypothetical protein